VTAVSVYENSTDTEAIKQSLETPASFAQVLGRHFGSVHRCLSQRLGPPGSDFDS
jgi:hypothetical protein